MTNTIATKNTYTIATKMANTIATNIMSTALKNCHTKKVRDCYILHSFISDHIIIDNYYYLLSLCKTKKVQYEMENNEF